MRMIFKNRKEAGILLGESLLKKGVSKNKEVITIGLPRGGVPIAFEVANLLNSPLDILFVRKLGFPYHEEVAMGAITEDGGLYLDEDITQKYLISPATIQKIIAREKGVIDKRKITYRDVCPKKEVKGKTVILTDDGLATGATVFAAIESIRKEKPHKIIVAVPVSPMDAYTKLKKCVDDLICLNVAQQFFGVGGFYRDFPQVDDKEVINLLSQYETKNMKN